MTKLFGCQLTEARYYNGLEIDDRAEFLRSKNFGSNNMLNKYFA